MVSCIGMKKELIHWGEPECHLRNTGLTRLGDWITTSDKLIDDHRNAFGNFFRERAIGVGVVGNLQACMECKLLHNVMNMALDGVGRYLKIFRYFLIA